MNEAVDSADLPFNGSDLALEDSGKIMVGYQLRWLIFEALKYKAELSAEECTIFKSGMAENSKERDAFRLGEKMNSIEVDHLRGLEHMSDIHGL
jgi:hypothetical protein